MYKHAGNYYRFRLPESRTGKPLLREEPKEPGEWMLHLSNNEYLPIEDGSIINKAQARANYLHSIGKNKIPAKSEIVWCVYGKPLMSKSNDTHN